MDKGWHKKMKKPCPLKLISNLFSKIRRIIQIIKSIKIFIPLITSIFTLISIIIIEIKNDQFGQNENKQKLKEDIKNNLQKLVDILVESFFSSSLPTMGLSLIIKPQEITSNLTNIINKYTDQIFDEILPQKINLIIANKEINNKNQ